MPPTCTICRHEKRAEIEAALKVGESFRNVAKRFATSPTALFRHKAHQQRGSEVPGEPGGQAEKVDATEIEEIALLPREEKLASLLAQGNISVAEACRQCGFNPSSTTIRNRLKPGGDIHTVVVRRMRGLGLTLDVALLKVRDMYDARKEVPNPAANSRGAQLAAMVSGKPVTPTLELRDNESQRWAAEQTLKLHGAYPEKGENPQPPTPLEVETIFTDVTLPDGRVGRHMRVRIGQREAAHEA